MTDDPSDEMLAGAARQGDRTAFDRLVRRHKQPLYRYVRRYAGNNADAQDLLQEAFLAAWLALGSFDTARAFAPWLWRIALNKCRDWGRRQAVRRIMQGRWAQEPVLPVADHGKEAQLQALDRAIAALPPALKEALLLTASTGLSHIEAGAMLGISAKSVEMRLYRARAKLRELCRGIGAPEA